MSDLLQFKELSPLHFLLADEQITEIVVNAAQSIYYEKFGILNRSKEVFDNLLHYMSAVDRLTEFGRTFLNREKPFVEMQIDEWRLTLIYGEISGSTPLLSLRRRPQGQWSLEKLVAEGWCAAPEFHFIKTALDQKKNILVVGATSSGKTTVLQSFINSQPEQERWILIEDTPELQRPNAASASLVTRPYLNSLIGEVDLTQLIQRALRLRPDRLVLGEVRGPEAYSLLLALSTGHEGSLGTLHARNTQEALLRLEMLIQLGAPNWSLHSIRRLISLSLNLIVTVEKRAGFRQLKEIAEISSVEDSGLTTEKIYVRPDTTTRF